MDDASQPSLPPADAKYLLSALDRMDSVFGIFYEPTGYEAAKNADGGGGGSGESTAEGELPEIMAELLAKRLAARESKDWATADAVRDEIKALGYAVKVRRVSYSAYFFCCCCCCCCRLPTVDPSPGFFFVGALYGRYYHVV